MSTRSRLLIALSFLVACNDESPFEPLSELPFAYATNSCGPADGPTVLVYLAAQSFELPQPVAPFIQINLPISSTTLKAGDVFHVDDGDFMAPNAFFHGSGVEPRAASDGEIGVTAFSANALSGYVDLEFPGGQTFRGTFIASWQTRQTFCG